MAAPVEIVTGIPGAGKTDKLLERFRDTLRRRDLAAADPVLWLTPTHRSREEIRSQLLSADLAACFAPSVLTFEQFADEILRTATPVITPLGESAKRLLLRRTVEDLSSRGEISYFVPIVHTSGFVRLLAGFIAELKREEIWPEHFERASQSRHGDARDRELLAIYNAYQVELQSQQRYDAEGRFWSARSALQQGHVGSFESPALVVADGFADFTRTQYEILEILSQTASSMLVALPAEATGERPDLFAKSRAAIEQLERRIPSARTTHLGESVAVHPFPAMGHIARRMFANPRTIEARDDAAGIEILAVTGEGSEATEIARRVKSLIRGGTSPSQVVVVLRRLDEAAVRFVEAFREASIPLDCDATISLLRTPLLKILLALLRMELDDWSFEGVMGVLHSSVAGPDWPEFRETGAVSAVAATLRHHGLQSGRTTILATLDRLTNRASGTHNPQTRRAAALLRRLSQATDGLRLRHAFGQWVDVVVSLARTLGIAPRAPASSAAPRTLLEKLDARDREVWEAFEGALFDAARFDATIDRQKQPISLEEFVDRLQELLEPQTIRIVARRSGGVRLLDAGQVRGLDVPHLFFAGLTESSVPARRGDDCLYGEAERREWNEHGLSLPGRSSHLQGEMLLFYSAVTRARCSLTLSYASVSDTGQPLFPSPYLTALQELFEPGAVPVMPLGSLDPVPEAGAVHTRAEFRVYATDCVRRGDAGPFRRLWEDRNTRDVAANILASVALNVDRFHSRGFSVFEGLLGNAENIRRIHERFDDEYSFSATQFEKYGTCPFQFFLKSVLKVSELETPEAATDQRQRGLFVHDILAELHQSLAPENASAEGIQRHFCELVEERLGRRPSDSELQAALATIERRLMLRWSEAYAEQWDDYRAAYSQAWDDAPQPAFFEIPFGDPPGDAPEDADAPRFGHLALGRAGRTVRVRGRIDRIDVGRCDGRDVFNVVDYKTGNPNPFSESEVAAGRSLQMALYLLAVHRLGIAGKGARPWQVGFWRIKRDGFFPGLRTGNTRAPDVARPLDEAALDSLEEILERIVPQLADGIRNGRFPVQNSKAECVQHCCYNTICRVREIRSIAERLGKHYDIGTPAPDDART